jgi:hypothetical protein
MRATVNVAAPQETAEGIGDRHAIALLVLLLVPRVRAQEPEYTAAERAIIDLLEWDRRRKLTPEEIFLSLEQARAIHGEDLEG